MGSVDHEDQQSGGMVDPPFAPTPTSQDFETLPQSLGARPAQLRRSLLPENLLILMENDSAVHMEHDCETIYPPGSFAFYRTLGATVFCVLAAATCAGLTMGLIAIDEVDLLIVQEANPADCEDEEERSELMKKKSYASIVLPLIQRHHHLLVTLLLLNSIANESLPLFLDSLVPSWIAIALSVSLLLLFAEILPSAFFTGSSGLRISAALAPFVYFSMFVTAPLSWPVAKILDRWLGTGHSHEEAVRYPRSHLMALLRLQLNEDASQSSPSLQQKLSRVASANHGSSLGLWSEDGNLSSTPLLYKSASSSAVFPIEGDSSSYTPTQPRVKGSAGSRPPPTRGGGLAQHEVNMMRGALQMRDVEAQDVMTRASEVFFLDENTVLDLPKLVQIVCKGHSRIPVVQDGDLNRVRGVLPVKILTGVHPDRLTLVGSLDVRPPTFVSPDLALGRVLKEMRLRRSHLCIVTDDVREMYEGNPFGRARVLGVVSLIDVIQKLVDEKLADDDGRPPSLGAAHEDPPSVILETPSSSALHEGDLSAGLGEALSASATSPYARLRRQLSSSSASTSALPPASSIGDATMGRLRSWMSRAKNNVARRQLRQFIVQESTSGSGSVLAPSQQSAEEEAAREAGAQAPPLLDRRGGSILGASQRGLSVSFSNPIQRHSQSESDGASSSSSRGGEGDFQEQEEDVEAYPSYEPHSA